MITTLERTPAPKAHDAVRTARRYENAHGYPIGSYPETDDYQLPANRTEPAPVTAEPALDTLPEVRTPETTVETAQEASRHQILLGRIGLGAKNIGASLRERLSGGPNSSHRAEKVGRFGLRMFQSTGGKHKALPGGRHKA
jgi:hypothetical protein